MNNGTIIGVFVKNVAFSNYYKIYVQMGVRVYEGYTAYDQFRRKSYILGFNLVV